MASNRQPVKFDRRFVALLNFVRRPPG